MDKNNTDNIKIKFTKIKDERNKIRDLFIKLQKLKNNIKENYLHYIQKEKSDFYGLDSFHFQNKVIKLEFENMMRLYQFIDNRIYGDYYKLFVQIYNFLKKTLTRKQYEKIKELDNVPKYPVYKDLNQFKTYDFDTINNIHQDIIIVTMTVKDIYKENELSINEDMKKMMTGMNIDNYIINNQYKNMNLITTNTKFQNYLQVYHKYHYDLLIKFYEKLSLVYRQILLSNKQIRNNEEKYEMTVTPSHKNTEYTFERDILSSSDSESSSDDNAIVSKFQNDIIENSDSSDEGVNIDIQPDKSEDIGLRDKRDKIDKKDNILKKENEKDDESSKMIKEILNDIVTDVVDHSDSTSDHDYLPNEIESNDNQKAKKKKRKRKKK